MSSVALKFTSLAIRTLSKPIANYIKRQSREHPGFRRTCIGFAQSLHRIDMRWRIGLLQDTAAIEKQIQRDAAKEAAKKKQSTAPTVKTEAQTKADEEAAQTAKTVDEAANEAEKHRPPPKIRPLSEAKAIETGANFISETFLFSVAAGLILFETWRSRRKESNRRDVVKDRLDDLEESERAARQALIELEREVLELRARHPETNTDKSSSFSSSTVPSRDNRILPREIYEQPPDNDSDKDSATDEVSKGWLSRIATYIGSKADAPGSSEEQQAGPKVHAPDREEGPAARILAESDRKLDARHRQQAAEDAAAAETEESVPPVRTADPNMANKTK